MNANARAATETPQEAARRLSAYKIKEGYQPQALHAYRNAAGINLYWRIRLKHPSGDKWIRPMYWNGTAYVLGEPPAPPNGKPLYRLSELLAAPPDARVFVVEGEACADVLAKLGVVAVTSGGKGSANAADWAPLRRRAVTIWPDNDRAGGEYAAAVAAKLGAVGCAVQVVLHEITAGLPAKGDCVDWLAQRRDAVAADVLALPTVPVPETAAPVVIEPEPLRRPLPLAAKYPLDALGDVLGDAARAICDVVQAPAAMCGTSILAAASLAAQHLVNVRHDSFDEPLSVWAVTIGESGERKSAVDKWALGAHYQHEHDARALYDADARSYGIAQAAYAAAIQKAKGGKGSSRDAVERALEAVGTAPQAPLVPLLVLGEPTLEGTQRQLIHGWPSIGLFSSDAGEFLGGFSMSAEQKTRTAASLSKLWDNGTFDRVRAKADEVSGKYYGRRVALHLMVQPVIAEAVLSDATLCGQGFLPRCLLAWPESTQGTRDYVAVDLHDSPALHRYWGKMHALLERPYPLADGTRNELEPRALGLAPDAAALWVQFQNAAERELADGGKYASVRAWAAKAGAQALRVAGVLTLADNPDAGTIAREAVERACELVLWHLGEAVRIVGTAAIPPEVQDAEALLDWCHETRRQLLHSRAALRLGPYRVRTRQAFDAAMRELERSGWAVPVEGGAVVDGKRRRRVWRIVEGTP